MRISPVDKISNVRLLLSTCKASQIGLIVSV